MTNKPTPASQPSPALDRTDYSARVVQTNTATIVEQPSPAHCSYCSSMDYTSCRHIEQPSPARSDKDAERVDTAEFRKLTYAYAEALFKGTVPATQAAWGAVIDHVAKLAATHAGEAQERPARLSQENSGTDCVTLPAERAPISESIDTPEFRSLLADYCNARTDGTVAAEKYCLDDLITHIDAHRATARATATGALGDLAALLPSDFMWGDALQPAILREILSAYIHSEMP